MFAPLRHLRIGWRFFGSELKRYREAAGLTQQELGDVVFVSGSYVGQFEQAIRRPQLDIAQRMDTALDTGGLLARMCAELVNGSPYDAYFAPVAELEPQALTICEYAPTYVPGLLQTPEYTRATMAPRAALKTTPDVDVVLATRAERAKLLDTSEDPTLWVILHEVLLRIAVGGPAVMAAQLNHIVQRVSEHRLIVQVLPFSAGAAAAVGGMFQLMTFADAPPVVYCEAAHTGILVDEPSRVGRYQQTYDLLRAAALSPEASLDLIESAARTLTP
ncbi:helix-turn-helix transcriptional regulator [Streptomyces bomunensis]|uniref:Helix-turn-helix transcriptional regulator n=2 Tax=Streptomyces montanisoli TaxID=2798581 RepID=A0A940MJH0_9ACTN|nr:helix-turn-helix transcriptional regulator [Streptomyces montanisoli]